MSVLWEWVGEGELKFSTEVVPVIGGGAFTFRGEFSPVESGSWEARGVTQSWCEDLKTHLKSNAGQYTLTDKHGLTTSGEVETFRWGWRELNGTALLVARIDMVIPPPPPGDD